MNWITLGCLLCAQAAATAEPMLEIHAAPGDRVIPEFGRAIGENLTAGPAFRDEMIVLRVDTADPREAMTTVAEALDAVWERTEQGWRLTLLPEAERELSRARQAAPVASLAQDIRRQVAELGELDLEDEAGNSLLEEPANRLTIKLAAEIGADELAEVQPGERRVYSLQPNALQYPLPVSAQSAVDAYWREYADSVEAYSAQKVERAREERGVEVQADWRYVDLSVNDKRMLLVVEGEQLPGVVNLEVKAYLDLQGGYPMGQTTLGLPDGAMDMEIEPAPELEGVLVDLSPLDDWFLRREPSQSTPEQLASARTLFLDREAPDPVAKGASYALLEAAKALDKQLVAVIPDSAAFTIAVGTGVFTNEPQVLDEVDLGQMLGANGIVDLGLKVGEEVIRVDPLVYGPFASISFDRDAVRSLIQNKVDYSEWGVDLTSDFMAQFDSVGHAMGTLTLYMTLLGRSSPPIHEPKAIYRLYASLNQTQRAATRQEPGFVLTWRELTPQMRASLQQLLLSQDVANELQNQMSRRLTNKLQNLAENDWMQEPTNFFAGGVPPKTRVRIRVEETEELIVREPWNQLLSPHHVMRLKDGNLGEDEKIQAGTYQNLIVSIEFSPEVSITESEDFFLFDEDAPALTLADLPPELLKEAEEYRQRMRQAPPPPGGPTKVQP